MAGEKHVVGWDGQVRLVPLDEDDLRQMAEDAARAAEDARRPKPRSVTDEIAELKARVAELEAQRAPDADLGK